MSAIGFVLPAATIGLGSLLLKPQRGFYSPAVPAQRDADGNVTKASVPTQALLVPQITIEEQHHDEIVITDHPVEKGAMVSDHFFKLPESVTIHAAWSNSPGGNGSLIGAAVGVAGALGGPLARIAAAAGPTFGAIKTIQSVLSGNASDQVTAIYKQLRALQVSGAPFDVYTGKRVYNNMLLKSISVTTNVSTENALVVTMHCRQIIIAETVVTSTTVNNAALANPQDSSIVPQGAVSLKDVSASVAESVSATVQSSLPASVSGAVSALSSSLPSIGEIPLGDTQQLLSVALNNVQQQVQLTWNNPSASWLADIADSAGSPIAQGLALMPGSDLLGQLKYLGIGGGGALVTQTDGNPNQPPGFSDLGSSSHLYFAKA